MEPRPKYLNSYFMFDCIIVGAGPAGGSAAYHLAKQGRSVLILERDELPRYKPCGGGVSPAIAQWFDFDFSPAISCRVDTLRYTFNLEDPVDVKLENQEPIWMVRRDIFDHFIVQQAQKQGAELRDNTQVTGIEFKVDRWQVNTANGSVEGKYLIAADGAKGNMAKWLGFKDRKRRLAGALEVDATSDNVVNAINFEFGLVKNGYIWNFPKAEGYSIGIGTFRGGEAQDFKKILDVYGKSAFGIDINNFQQHGHPLCLWDGDQKLHTQNAVLAGEAACVVDPMTAEGIRPSILSGIKAADAIHAALNGTSNALEKYTQIMATEWGADMKWAQRLAAAFYQFPKVSYKAAVKRPSASMTMARVLAGELSYSDIAGKAIKKLSGSLFR
ncbi:geranylgeranyl reductase family protein [Chamaesiphon sp.]|uniref:geranylgeranyl reductase family protein n=1 Tax=Chamaesiphon sp. TaxID=2814140 RepID=UPI0035938EDF